MAKRYFIPALAGIYESSGRLALPLLRITLGLILIPHGMQKFFGSFGGAGFARFAQIFETIGYKPGALWVTLVAGTELVGGIMLILGLFTRFWAAAVAIFMVNAIWTTSEMGFFWTKQGSEYSILILICALVFLARGGGEFSLDGKMPREL